MTFRRMTIEDALKEAQNIPRDLLDGIVSNTVTIFYGAPGIGKTTIIGELIAAGLDGRDFSDHSWSRPLNQVSVITTDADGAVDYAELVNGARTRPASRNDDVTIWPLTSAPRSREWAELTSLVMEDKPDLVVLDNIGQAVSGPLNEDQTARDLWADLASLREAGTALLWVAHTPKPGSTVVDGVIGGS